MQPTTKADSTKLKLTARLHRKLVDLQSVRELGRRLRVAFINRGGPELREQDRVSLQLHYYGLSIEIAAVSRVSLQLHYGLSIEIAAVSRVSLQLHYGLSIEIAAVSRVSLQLHHGLSIEIAAREQDLVLLRILRHPLDAGPVTEQAKKLRPKQDVNQLPQLYFFLLFF